jgi:hypothetical protein
VVHSALEDNSKKIFVSITYQAWFEKIGEING